MPELETLIADWKSYLLEKGHFSADQQNELESHLRDAVAELQANGLDEEEAFLIAIKRMGNLPALASEYARVHTDQIWKQLLIEPNEDGGGSLSMAKKYGWVAALALFAGILGKVPSLFGYGMETDHGALVHLLNGSYFVLIPMTILFGQWNRALSWRRLVTVAGVLVGSLILVNTYPSYRPEHTRVLSILHLPIFLWIATGALYMGDHWNTVRGRMDFVRFTGETFIYTVLILCGIGVLIMLVGGLFSSIDLNPGDFIGDYLLVFGGCAAPVLGAFFAHEKRSIVENMAPVLARIFAPLFLVTLLAFLVVFAVKGTVPGAHREFLIIFDLALALVLGIVLYLVSARRAREPIGIFDWVALALIGCALLANGVALWAIGIRLADFGPSPNRVAALGENVLLCVHLAALGWCFLRFLRHQAPFEMIERWLTRYLWVYFTWAGCVALAFPVLFYFK